MIPRRTPAHDYGFPLDVFRDFIGHDPWHFWGMSDPAVNPKQGCDALVRERSHMSAEAAGRADIRQAINQGIAKLTRYLGYAPMPHAVRDVDLTPTPSGAPAYPLSYRSPSAGAGGLVVQLSEGFVQSIGAPVWTRLGSAAITMHDDDGDSYPERFTASYVLPSGITSADDLGVFFVAGDRPGGAPLGPASQIAPLGLEIVGTTLEIVGDSWLIVPPLLYQGYQRARVNNGLSPFDAATFAAELDIAQRTINPSGAVMVTTLTGGACCSASTAATTESSAEIVNARQGLIRLGSWCDCSAPRRVSVRYMAGMPLLNTLPDPDWIDTICKIGCAELARRICMCDYPNAPIFEYGQDLADTNQGMSTAPEDLDNPLGTRRGHIEAWRAIKHLFTTVSQLP